MTVQCSGHIRKRVKKNGVIAWQIVVETPADYITGKRKRIYKTITGPKKDAENELRNLMFQTEKGYSATTTRLKVGEWVEQYMETYVKKRVTETTYHNYQKIVKSYILPELGGIELQKLTTMDVQKWINGIHEKSPVSGKEVSPKTLRNIFRTLSPAMKKALVLHIITEDPCQFVELPRNTHKSNTHEYDLNTIRQIISAAEASGNIMELAVPLLISTGLRRGELLDLKFSDIDFDNKKLTVDSSRVIAGKQVVVKDTKTKSSVRTVYLPDTIVGLLKKRKVEYMKNKLALGSKFNDTDLVVSKEDGSGYYPETISNLFYRMLAKNDLPHMRLHDLRAINATVMISECKIDPRTASQRLGHSNSNFTLAVYANLLKSANEDAAEKIDSALFKKAEIS